MKSEQQHIAEFIEHFIIPVDGLGYEIEVSFIDFIIKDKQTQIPKMCIEFKKNTTTKDKMFEQLRRTRGVINLGDDYEWYFGAINKTHFYIKDNK